MKTIKIFALACAMIGLFAGTASADLAPPPNKSKCSAGDGADSALWLGSLVVVAYARRKTRRDG